LSTDTNYNGGNMPLLNEQQNIVALDIMNEYLSKVFSDGKTAVEIEDQLDKERVKLIDSELKPLISDYLQGKVELADFKIKINSINAKNNDILGFNGIKGQMFFNMVYNVAEDINELDAELKAAITAPQNEDIASSRIKTFTSFVKRLAEQWIDSGNSPSKAPKVSSIPFFLSYFWQIQDNEKWPLYYTNSVNTMNDLNFWQPSGDQSQDYLTFKGIHEELAQLFSKHAGEKFNLYKVEHVFSLKGGKLGRPENLEEIPLITEKGETERPSKITRLPDSYVPPIIAILPQMAANTEELGEAAKNSGIKLETAFEKYINIAFKILGYETTLMGQSMSGKKVPDGIAKSLDDNYAILWDAKARSDKYTIGTDDRTIREYINTQIPQLKKHKKFKKIYYLIISSAFDKGYSEPIENLKMETDISEVILVEADALVAMVEAKIRDPQQITLGPDGLQRLFSESRILTGQDVRSKFM